MSLSVNSILSLKISELLNASKERFCQYLDTLNTTLATSPTAETAAVTTDENTLVEDGTESDNFWKGLTQEQKEQLFDALNTDGDEKLSAEELGIYSGIDGDTTDVSQEDLAEVFKKLGIETPEDTTLPEEEPVKTPSGSSKNYNSYNDTIDPDKTSQPKETAEQVRKEIQAKEAEKQGILTKEAGIISQYEQEMYDYLLKEGSIKQEVLDEYQKNNAAIDAQIAEKQTQIIAQEAIYQENTAQVGALGASIGKIDTQITSLESEYQEEQAKALRGEENTASDIQNKINNLKTKKASLEQEKEAAQKAADTAKETKNTLEQEKEALETQKTALKTKLIQDSAGTITEDAKNSIKLVEEEIKKIKEESKAVISSLDTEIASLKTKAAQLEREEEANKVISENSTKADNTAIAANSSNPYDWSQYGYNAEVGEGLAAAAETVGMNMERQGSKHNCLGGVKRSFLKYFGESPFGNPGAGIHAAAKTIGVMENSEDFREVTGLSINDLEHLPAGAVIVWSTSSGSSAASKYGHISISLGDGRESSDNVRDQYHRVGSNGVPRVFIPI